VTGPAAPDTPGEPVIHDLPDDQTPVEVDQVEPTAERKASATRRTQRRGRLAPVRGRTAAVVAIVAVVAGAGLVNAAAPAPTPPPAPVGFDGLAIAPADASSSSLFCAMGAGGGAGAGATGVVVLTNTTTSAAQGVMTTVRAGGAAPVRRTIVVPPLGQTDVIPAAGLPDGVTAASFTFRGGGVSAMAVVGGAAGWSTAECPTRVASSWYIPGGGTADGPLSLSLFNPTAATTVVYLTFLTTSGAVLVPQKYQGIVVPPEQVVTESLGDYVQGQSVVTTLVQASSGSLVATELHRPTGPAGAGLSLLAGVPDRSTTWRFGQTTALAGGTVDLVLANPSAGPATAQVSVGLPSATVLPRTVAVAGRGMAVLRVSSLPGWPLGAPYAITVRSTVPLVVGRTVAAPPGAPAPRTGAGPATSSTARSWLVVGPGKPDNPVVAGATIASLAVANPGNEVAEVQVSALTSGARVATVQVAPHSLAVLGSKIVGGRQPLVVTSSVAVVIEGDYGPTGAPGIAYTSGVPLAH